MGQVRNFIQEAAFDPETIKVLVQAYERACASLHDTGQPLVVRQAIAQRIIAAAAKGERDPDNLLREALKGLAH